ncbi:MAG: AbrB/MazE/SpoVT family DNA-binding domain-containing protein [Candidatus Omnitrophica bacterium]|nr:AbrB/MazE/SpoVT family DNA-binding domain-containing protein [Candidatus Omnitrophota bacterium]
MVSTLPKSVKLWGRGQLTIPKEAREALKLGDEAQLNVFVVGQCLMLTPKRLMRASLAKDVEKSMKEQRLSLKDLLNDLKIERRRYTQEKHAG